MAIAIGAASFTAGQAVPDGLIGADSRSPAEESPFQDDPQPALGAPTTPTLPPDQPTILSIAMDPNTTAQLSISGDGSASLIRVPVHGIVQVESSGILTYRPHADFHGSDDFEIQVCEAKTCTITSISIDVR